MPHEKFMECIEACNHCANACEHCAAECLREDDVKTMVHCIALNRDCAVVCHTASFLMGGGSEHSGEVCELCADVCHACAAECRKFDQGHCRHAAEMCRRCATECERVASEALESLSAV